MQHVINFIQASRKAVVGLIVASVGVYVAQQGWTLDTTVGEIVSALPAGVVTFIGVWFTRNR